MAGGGGLVFGPGSLTQGQVVALTSVTVVGLLLLSANVAVCWLYRRAVTQDERHRRRQHREKQSKMWVYHVHRTASYIPGTTPESGAQQILRKLQTSHHNMQARLAAEAAAAAGGANSTTTALDDYHRQNSLRREEAQALEELEVTTDLFLYDTVSRASSRRSSLGSGRSRVGSDGFDTSRDGHALSPGRPRSDTASALFDLQRVSGLSHLDPDSDTAGWDFDTASTARASDSTSAALQELDDAFAMHDLDLTASSYDLEVASALADLDMASALHDLDPDKVSMSSVTLADFTNDVVLADFGAESPRRKKTRWSKRRRRGSCGSQNKGDHSSSLPVAEFHNEAFDFSETRTAVERMKDVEL